MKKILTKKNLIRIGFLLLLVVTIYFISNILRVKSYHGINQIEGLYWQPENSIDAVMMGSSHVHCNVNTALLWEKYGIASYDYSGAEQPLWMTYHYLRELYKHQNPKIVVLDLYAPARFKEDYQYDWISENIYGMRLSWNKLEMLAVSVEPAHLFQYFPSFMVYHDRYDDLKEEDFNHFWWDGEEKQAFKGYTPYWEKNPQTMPSISESEAGGLSEKSEKYLRKIIDFMEKKEGELILIVAPYIITEEDQKVYNQIAEIAREEEITFINYNEYYKEMGLDFGQDFNDESHLNYWGSCKFTNCLGEFLSSFDNIKDRRGEEGYESWEDNVKMIQEELNNYGKAFE
ncbi:MAG: hypothetical protein NC429_02090 [Lachnospiraceae bacterium]|nr:hypothetical protein [Lachnospiraceae bacterium]